MTDDLKHELLHLVEHARGEPTEQLFLDIHDLREGKVWKFAEPRNVEVLRRMLMSLSAIGQITNVAGRGWMLTSAVPKSERRTFEEVTQGSLFG